jgi:2-octaprenyl-6-methoxyphenol hydroxylase
MLPGTRSAIVWSVPAGDSAAVIDLPDRAMAAEIEKRMGGFLGTVEMAGPRWTYPLGFHHAATITAERLALVGDAAHGIHPIAGQGLNLGFRDAAALAQVLVEGARLGMDLGDSQLLGRYERWRSLDTFMVAAATDGLTRLYGVPGRAASAVRRFGMGLVGRLGPLKDRLMAEARGESGDLPLLLRGLPI